MAVEFAENRFVFAVTYCPVDDLDSSKDVSFGERRERLMGNVKAVFAQELERALTPGMLPKGWGKLNTSHHPEENG